MDVGWNCERYGSGKQTEIINGKPGRDLHTKIQSQKNMCEMEMVMIQERSPGFKKIGNLAKVEK